MKHSDIVDRPVYEAPDKCPICRDWPLNGYTPDIKNNGRWRNDIRISVPAYDFGKDCPVCGSSNTVFQKDGSELREDGEMVFIWRCSMCGREYEVPSKEISQRMYAMKRRFIEKFPESFAYGGVAALTWFGAVSLLIIFIVYIFK